MSDLPSIAHLPCVCAAFHFLKCYIWIACVFLLQICGWIKKRKKPNQAPNQHNKAKHSIRTTPCFPKVLIAFLKRKLSHFQNLYPEPPRVEILLLQAALAMGPLEAWEEARSCRDADRHGGPPTRHAPFQKEHPFMLEAHCCFRNGCCSYRLQSRRRPSTYKQSPWVTVRKK